MFPGSYVPRVLCSPVVPGSLYATGELRTLFLKKGPMFPALYLAKLRNCALTKTIPKPNLSQGVVEHELTCKCAQSPCGSR